MMGLVVLGKDNILGDILGLGEDVQLKPIKKSEVCLQIGIPAIRHGLPSLKIVN